MIWINWLYSSSHKTSFTSLQDNMNAVVFGGGRLVLRQQGSGSPWENVELPLEAILRSNREVIRKYLETFLMVAREVLLATSRWRPGRMLLNIPQCTRQSPTTQNYSVHMSIVARLRKPGLSCAEKGRSVMLDYSLCLWFRWRLLPKYLLRSFCTSIRYTVGALHRVVMG